MKLSGNESSGWWLKWMMSFPWWIRRGESAKWWVVRESRLAGGRHRRINRLFRSFSSFLASSVCNSIDSRLGRKPLDRDVQSKITLICFFLDSFGQFLFKWCMITPIKSSWKKLFIQTKFLFVYDMKLCSKYAVKLARAIPKTSSYEDLGFLGNSLSSLFAPEFVIGPSFRLSGKASSNDLESYTHHVFIFFAWIVDILRALFRIALRKCDFSESNHVGPSFARYRPLSCHEQVFCLVVQR